MNSETILEEIKKIFPEAKITKNEAWYLGINLFTDSSIGVVIHHIDYKEGTFQYANHGMLEKYCYVSIPLVPYQATAPRQLSELISALAILNKMLHEYAEWLLSDKNFDSSKG